LKAEKNTGAEELRSFKSRIEQQSAGTAEKTEDCENLHAASRGNVRVEKVDRSPDGLEVGRRRKPY